MERLFATLSVCLIYFRFAERIFPNQIFIYSAHIQQTHPNIDTIYISILSQTVGVIVCMCVMFIGWAQKARRKNKINIYHRIASHHIIITCQFVLSVVSVTGSIFTIHALNLIAQA